MQTRITENQKKFCQAYRLYGDATRAYREAFAPKGSQASVSKSACVLLAKPAVQEYLSVLESESRKEHNVTIQSIAAEFEEVRQLALADKKYEAANTAIAGKAKVYGLMETRVKHTHTMRLDESLEIIARLLPKYAHMLPPSIRVIENTANDEAA